MDLQVFNGKKVKLITTDNEIFTGEAYDFIPKQDNVLEMASISIGSFEFYENEIKSIELA